MRIRSPLEFRRFTTLMYGCAALGMAVIPYVLMYFNGTNPVAYLVSRAEWAIPLIAMYVGTIWFGLLGVAILRGLFGIGSPLFVEGGRLVYLHPRLWSADLESVLAIVEQPDEGEWPLRGALRVQIQMGKDKWLSTTLIQGDKQTVANKLNGFIRDVRAGLIRIGTG